MSLNIATICLHAAADVNYFDIDYFSDTRKGQRCSCVKLASKFGHVLHLEQSIAVLLIQRII